MPVLTAQHAYHDGNGVPEDVYVNTWHFNVPTGLVEPSVLTIEAALKNFYDTKAPTALQPPPYYFARSPLVGSATIKIYNTGDPRPRVPLSTLFYQPTVGSPANPLPYEVACCLSFEGQAASGTVAARRKGRVYLGPLNVRCIEGTDQMIPATVSTVFRQDMLKQAQQLSAELLVGACHVAVFSTVDQLGYEVVRYWLDDAFDTQRRRGTAPKTSISGPLVASG